MPVVNANGLVGKTVFVTRGESRVLLLLDPNCKASALLQDTREHGLVSGRKAAWVRQPRLQMTFVDRNAKIERGQVVITSGFGGVVPKGIVIGATVQARLAEVSELYQEVEVKPAVDFRRLEEVIVILSDNHE